MPRGESIPETVCSGTANVLGRWNVHFEGFPNFSEFQSSNYPQLLQMKDRTRRQHNPPSSQKPPITHSHQHPTPPQPTPGGWSTPWCPPRIAVPLAQLFLICHLQRGSLLKKQLGMYQQHLDFQQLQRLHVKGTSTLKLISKIPNPPY